MTILASLARAYERLSIKGDAPPFGYARINIGFAVRIDGMGRPTCNPIDLRQPNAKAHNLIGQRIEVPTFLSQRTSGIDPNFLWDKTAYALGIDKPDPKKSAEKQAEYAARVVKMHQSFFELHQKYLSMETDIGLVALLRFLECWKPENYGNWPEDMKGENIVFQLDGDTKQYIHARPAAKKCWARILSDEPASEAICLINGTKSRIAASHPPIKNVAGAQSSGAFIVSFNQDAFTSYGHEQGDNAPVSEAAAFAYATALNLFLQNDSGHRMQIGDASTVYWADASDATAAKDAEDLFADFLEIDEGSEAKKITAILENVRLGRPPADFKPDLPKDVRFHVLGLAPNIARLSVRFYIEDDFDAIAANFLDHFARLRIEPPPKNVNPPMWRYLVETATSRESKNVPPNLAGEFLRAILTGAPYPHNLLATLLMRIRAEKLIPRNPKTKKEILDSLALRVSLLKAILLRNHPNFNSEVPVSLDPANKDPGYLLGRLFATYEYAQSQALGGNVSATIRDQYYGAASATPRAVFPVLQRKAANHLSRLRKDKPGLAVNLDRDIGEIFDLADADKLFAPILTMQHQAMFAIGYYHQRNKFFRPKDEIKLEANSKGQKQ